MKLILLLACFLLTACDQLAELDRDVERGTIGQAEADAAKPATMDHREDWRTLPLVGLRFQRAYLHAGRAATMVFLRAAMEVLEDFRYVREIADANGRDHALVFEAKVDGKTITGCDFLHIDDDGLIDDFMVMVRPLSGATALAARMGEQFEQITNEAAEIS